LIALKASDVDFENRLINVQRTLSRGKDKAAEKWKNAPSGHVVATDKSSERTQSQRR
jgi:hypothetical protein